MKKTCLNCGAEFETKSHRAKFCDNNNKCKVAYNRKADKTTPKLEPHNTYLDPNNPSEAEIRRDKVNKLLIAKGLPPVILGRDIPPIEFISSGIAEIDQITGGFPKNRITEVFGMKGVGKTSLMSKILTKSAPTLKIFYVDTENSLHGDHPNIEVFSEYILEDIEGMVADVLDSNEYDLIIVDSVASMIPRAEVEGDEGEAHMGLKARLMSQWMRKINPHLHGKKAAVVFINQQRESMNPYGPREK
jgi:predicted ATP-dependent serine protease